MNSELGKTNSCIYKIISFYATCYMNLIFLSLHFFTYHNPNKGCYLKQLKFQKILMNTTNASYEEKNLLINQSTNY